MDLKKEREIDLPLYANPGSTLPNYVLSPDNQKGPFYTFCRVLSFIYSMYNWNNAFWPSLPLLFLCRFCIFINVQYFYCPFSFQKSGFQKEKELISKNPIPVFKSFLCCSGIYFSFYIRQPKQDYLAKVVIHRMPERPLDFSIYAVDYSHSISKKIN